MAATEFPQNLFHTGTANPLTLDVALQPPTSGDFTLSVAGNAAAQGWPAIPNGQKMVVTVGRGTEYEAKYLLSSVSSGQTSSTLTVLAADRNYDGTIPKDTPAGTLVEHTISATEMATVNDHMRTKSAHGSDGQLVDQNSAQVLSNKTLNDPIVAGARFTPVGTIVMWPSNTVPDGFLACNGQAITAQAYPELFAVIGGTVPNLTDKFVKAGPVNLTPQGSPERTLTEANMPAHKHDVTVGATQAAHNHGGATGGAGGHSHYFNVNSAGSSAWFGTPRLYQTIQGGGERDVMGINAGQDHYHNVSGYTDTKSDHTHSIASNTPAITVTVGEATKGSGTALNIEPAHIVLQYIICAKPQGA